MLESIYCTNTQLVGECFTTQCHYKILDKYSVISTIFQVMSYMLDI